MSYTTIILVWVIFGLIILINIIQNLYIFKLRRDIERKKLLLEEGKRESSLLKSREKSAWPQGHIIKEAEEKNATKLEN